MPPRRPPRYSSVWQWIMPQFTHSHTQCRNSHQLLLYIKLGLEPKSITSAGSNNVALYMVSLIKQVRIALYITSRFLSFFAHSLLPVMSLCLPKKKLYKITEYNFFVVVFSYQLTFQQVYQHQPHEIYPLDNVYLDIYIYTQEVKDVQCCQAFGSLTCQRHLRQVFLYGLK